MSAPATELAPISAPTLAPASTPIAARQTARRAARLRALACATALAALAATSCDRSGAASNSGLIANAGAVTSPPSQQNGAPSSAAASSASAFLKGQLHAHSDGSGDSETRPAEVAAWYAARGYDFLVFTDHNRVTDTIDPPGMLTLPGVELTQNRRECDPPPKPKNACLLHMNALFVTAPPVWGSAAPGAEDPLAVSWSPPRPPPGVVEARSAIYASSLAAARAMGGVAQLNHPNFHFAADASILAELVRQGLSLVEIANQAIDSTNEGDAEHPPVEALWDDALTRGLVVYGTATDDAHHYSDAAEARARGETAYVGDRGFVMVRSEKRPDAIRAAVLRGDFYSSTGALLDHLVMSRDAIEVDVRDRGGSGSPLIEVIGGGGAVLTSSAALSLRFDPRSTKGPYVRVRIRDARGDLAWTQPVFLTK